jgi:uncharacterized protein (TIGR00661 family)
MKILYAFNGTGYGHASRATSILPILKREYDVDILISGEQNPIDIGHDVKYRLRGFKFIYEKSSIDFLGTARDLKILHFLRDVLDLEVKNYDLVLSDFEPISAISSRLSGVNSISISHQASFISKNVPRPTGKNLLADFFMRNYAKCNHNIGFHFKRYEKFILPPHIRTEILTAKPTEEDYYVVYLSSVNLQEALQKFNLFPACKFKMFHPSIKEKYTAGNTEMLPIDKDRFIESLISSRGIITGGGFETVAESMYLQKKIMCIPIKGQYEQSCNAAAAEKMNAFNSKDLSFSSLKSFLESEKRPEKIEVCSEEEILSSIKRYL